MNDLLPIFVYLLTALVITQIPFLRVYFALCNILLHEIIWVMVEGAFINKIKLHYNRGRKLTNIEKSQVKHTLITYAGHTSESIAAIGLFYLVANQHYNYILYLFVGILGVAVILWIRNFWGFLWALSFIAFLAISIYFKYDIAIMHISILLSSLIFIQSILNGIKVCRQILIERKSPVRLGFFPGIKFIPLLMLGVVLLGQSLYAGFFIVRSVLSLY